MKLKKQPKYCAITGKLLTKPYYYTAVNCTFNVEAIGVINNPSKSVWISRAAAKKMFKWSEKNE